MSELKRSEPVTGVGRRIEKENGLVDRLRRVARLALPLNAAVAVASQGDDRLLDLNVPVALHFPAPEGDRTDAVPDDDGLIAELETRRSGGVQFLLIPSTGLPWFEQRPRFKSHVEETYRVVLDEEETCVVFALGDPPNDLPEDGIGPDGLPLPPPEMVHLTAGLFHGLDVYHHFYQLGELGAACIEATLNRNGSSTKNFESILDFGCGCGRIMRHWRSLGGPKLHGCDYNPYLVQWCQANLSLAEFTVNGIAPPLDYDDATFDFVYAISVFTHIVEDLQVSWASELARVIRPGGFALITLHGVRNLEILDEAQRERFESGELVVLRPERAGTNDTSVYHPERYTKDVLAKDAGFDVVDLWPGGAKDSQQDAVLLRRD